MKLTISKIPNLIVFLLKNLSQYHKIKKSINHKKINRNNLISKINKRKFSKKNRY